MAEWPVGGDPTATVVYAGTEELSTPAGVAADNVNLFWANAQLGQTHGTLVRGMMGAKTGNVGIAVNYYAGFRKTTSD